MKHIINIRKGDAQDIPQISLLWKDCFTEDESYLNHLFSTIYPEATVYVLIEDNNIAASLFLFNAKYINKEKNITIKGKYLYGVCTLNKYRKKGYAKVLIKHAINESIKENSKFMFGVPASPPLFAYYKALGFTINVPRGTLPFKPSDIEKLSTTELKIKFIQKEIKKNFPIRIEYEKPIIEYMVTSNEILNQSIYKNNKHFGIINSFDKNIEFDINQIFIGFEL